MTTFKTLLLAAAVLAPAAIVAPAQAQVSGIAVADPQGAIAGSKAWTTARGQIETTYKAQLDQAEPGAVGGAALAASSSGEPVEDRVQLVWLEARS